MAKKKIDAAEIAVEPPAAVPTADAAPTTPAVEPAAPPVEIVNFPIPPTPTADAAPAVEPTAPTIPAVEPTAPTIPAADAAPTIPPIDTEPPLAAPVTADDLLTPRRGPGRPKGSTKNQQRDESGHFVKPGPAPLANVPDFSKLGEMVFDLSTGTLSMALGPEWKPQSPEERAMVSNAIGQYLKSKEISDIPPGIMLAVVVLAYSAPRLNAPSTKEKIARGWLWLKAKFTRRGK